MSSLMRWPIGCLHLAVFLLRMCRYYENNLVLCDGMQCGIQSIYNTAYICCVIVVPQHLLFLFRLGVQRKGRREKISIAVMALLMLDFRCVFSLELSLVLRKKMSWGGVRFEIVKWLFLVPTKSMYVFSYNVVSQSECCNQLLGISFRLELGCYS